MRTPQTAIYSQINRYYRFVLLSWRAVVLLSGLTLAISTNAMGQEPPPGVEPMDDWVEFKQAEYSDQTVLVHLRTGYQRALILPESVKLLEPEKLPDSLQVDVDIEVVVFSPRASFDRQVIAFEGLDSGRIYKFGVRASPLGIRIPLQVNLPLNGE